MTDVVMNFIVSAVGILLVAWTIGNVVIGYEKEADEKDGRRRK